MTNMSDTTKKEINIEELAKAYEEAKANLETLSEQLKVAKQEEEDRRKAELALVKEARKKEVEDAANNYQKLLKEFLKDYGAIALCNSPDSLVSIMDDKLFRWWA